PDPPPRDGRATARRRARRDPGGDPGRVAPPGARPTRGLRGDPAPVPGERPLKVYVVTEPPSIRGIYETWPACKAAVAGVAGARYQAVENRERAEAMLRGEPVVLSAGLWAFVDGNHFGGIGVVLVEQGSDTGEPQVRREVATTVYEVFRNEGIPGLA